MQSEQIQPYQPVEIHSHTQNTDLFPPEDTELSYLGPECFHEEHEGLSRLSRNENCISVEAIWF